MKTKLKSLLLIGSLLALLAIPARAQVTSTTIYGLTNFPATLASGATSTTTNIVPLTKDAGFALQGIFNVSAGTSNVVVQGSFTVDGTNYGTAPWTWIIPANGTTRVVASTNWNRAQLAGFTGVNVTTVTNGNSGTLTNAGFLINRVAYLNAY